MRSAPSRCAGARALVLAGLWLAAAGRPLAFSDAGPHVHYGWGEPIRLRHLYTGGPHGLSSCFLRIRADGAVDCARGQSAHSECLPSPPLAPVPLSLTSFGSHGLPTLGNPRFLHLRVLSPRAPPTAREAGRGGHECMYLPHPCVTYPPRFSLRLQPTFFPENPRSWHLGVPQPPRAPRQRGELEGGVVAMGKGPPRRPHPRVVGSAGPICSFLLPSRPGLVEIRAVALRTVAIKGVRSVRYLCMGADGRMQGLVGACTRQGALGRGAYRPGVGACRGAGRAGSNPGFPRFPGAGLRGPPRQDGKGR